jgi:hypothetical protein
MGSLEESRKPRPQIVRYVNGPANGAQGKCRMLCICSYMTDKLQGADFDAFIKAIWRPCSVLRAANKKVPAAPPVTWEFLNSASGNRGIAASNGNHFIQKYGVSSAGRELRRVLMLSQFDSQTPGSECFGTYCHCVFCF